LWAADPTQKLGKTHSEPLGHCSDSSKLSKEECLKFGKCACRGAGLGMRDRCLKSFSASGKPCVFLPNNVWSAGPIKVDDSAVCSNRLYTSEESCLASGVCSNGQRISMQECLAAGTCLPPAEYRRATRHGLADSSADVSIGPPQNVPVLAF